MEDASAPADRVVVCAQCGKSVPVTNSALHLLRCRKSDTCVKQQQQQQQQLRNPRYSSAGEDTPAFGILNTEGNDLTSENNSGQREEIPQQWECEHCTFLNDFKQNHHNDETDKLQCSMCFNTSSSFEGDTWRISDTSAFREGSGSDDHHEDDMTTFKFEVNSNENENEEENECYIDCDDDNSLSTWTCTYCSSVNLSHEHACDVCEMPDSSNANRNHDNDRNIASSSAIADSSFSQDSLAAVPALCYLGLTVGALLTDSTRDPSTRMRNGLLGSVVGTVAGMALAMFMDVDEGETLPSSGTESHRSAAARLPVHRYKSFAKTQNNNETCCNEKDSQCEEYCHSRNQQLIEIDDDKVTCRICMEEYKHDVEIKTLKCFHMFHADCIDQWILRKTSCPLCWTDI